MRALEDQQRRQVPASGFGMVGKVLFEGPRLAEYCDQESANRLVAASAELGDVTPFSRLQVRRMFTEAVSIEPIRLNATAPEVKWYEVGFGLQCQVSLPFAGDTNLFNVSSGVASERPLMGSVADKELNLAVRYFACDAVMAPYALASELIAIEAALGNQHALIARHNEQYGETIAMMIKDHWKALCAMREPARRTSALRAAADRATLLRLYDLLFS